MIALILGTSEGKVIVEHLNKHTDNLLLSVASSYGGSLLENYKYKILNEKPLNKEQLENMMKNNNVTTLIDASHPYAVEITENAIEACHKLNINYIRYERPSVVEDFLQRKNVIEVEKYEDLGEVLKNTEGTILNTTGSRNIDKILNLKLENRIIHRVLPTLKVLSECEEFGVKVEDIIAMKGPFSKNLNISFIKEFNIKTMLLKDSGIQGGTLEKLQAVDEMNIKAIVIGRKKISYDKVFNNELDLVDYMVKENLI